MTGINCRLGIFKRVFVRQKIVTFKMSTMEQYARIVKQLNYEMETISPVRGKIHIPGGIPYEAFHSKDGKVKPWSLLSLIESGYFFSSYVPNKPLFEADQLFEDKLVIVAAVKLLIFPELYQSDTKKCPINIFRDLAFIGESSFTTINTITAGSFHNPLAIAEVSQVYFDPSTRKQTVLPELWVRKFRPLIPQKSSNHEKIQQQKNHHKCTYDVLPSDTDYNKHTNWTKYLQICYDACSTFASQGRYQGIDESAIASGVKSVLIRYKKESFELDTLTVCSWEFESKPGIAYFDVLNMNGDICSQASIQFMAPKQSLMSKM